MHRDTLERLVALGAVVGVRNGILFLYDGCDVDYLGRDGRRHFGVLNGVVLASGRRLTASV